MCRGDDGKIGPVPAEVRASMCKRFNPRKNCTTCGHGCSQDDKASRPFGSCPNWELRVLSTWGGNRRWPKKSLGNGLDSSENTKKEKVQ